MLKNYFIIGWRNLTKTRGYAFINITGLAIGMAVALLIGLWVLDEVNYNKSFKNHERLGLLYHHVTFGEQVLTINDVPAPIGNELKNNCADLEEVSMIAWAYEHVIGYQETTLIETGLFVEPQFADMFSVHMLEGSAKALKGVHAVLLSKTLAADLLGDNPVGKTIKSGNSEEMMVAGVFEDFPANSHFAEVRMLMPMAYYFSRGQQQKMDNWDNFDFECYVLLREHASFATAEPKIKNLLFEKASGAIKALNPNGILLPLEKWHLQATFKDGVNIGGQVRFVWMVGTIGVFVLLLACINFMNLSTARSEKRSKEVGVRKVMGSVRWQLVSQFLSESLMTVVISFVMALLMTALCLPLFNSMAEKKMIIPWTDLRFILISLVFMLVTSVLAGSYPALYLSSFNPVKVLKGVFRTGSSAGLPRKVMVVFQFTISIVLIIGTMVVFLQIQHAKNRPVGFDREGIVNMAVRTEELAKADYNTLRHELLSSGAATDMAKSDFPITGAMSDDVSLTWEGKDPTTRPLFGMNSCSHDFPKTNGFQFIEGRDFSREITSDSSAVIINEMAARLIASENPVNPKNPGQNVIGKKLKFADNKEREIIGVIKDQIRWTPFVNQTPHLYYINYRVKGHLTIRLNPNISTHEALKRTEAVIKKYDPLTPFDYKFQDDEYARLFKTEERVGRLATIFATLAIFISCIGIFGLAAFAVSQRTKEIGIRKVLGASALSLWKMLSGDFVRLVTISILVAVPLSYYLADEWLQQYDYRVELPWWVFAVTGALAILLTLLTVSYQSIKAAMVNPVKSLRSE
ncbi:ABC transporter permease [Fulvivirgaceae bacterium PWU4]|uniref:ABC transporter permease n=1 Tax=Chryseosolibacter histidini TaxID=2782349 RepID=A0AAP2DR80_9BACT|nr:FtsX-like permease family protein [Chryseosolibacter histidini]MBT1699853.1 ABC transporter permease [Chryseosolibacter histidini]